MLCALPRRSPPPTHSTGLPAPPERPCMSDLDVPAALEVRCPRGPHVYAVRPAHAHRLCVRRDAAGRHRLCQYLQRLGCEVCFWSRDFQMGRVILDEIRAASFACKYAIVLLTPDDRMSGRP